MVAKSEDYLNTIKLSSNLTIGDYRKFLAKEEKDEIAEFIYERFSERYIEPLKNSSKKNGFSIMANCCLMIEALESFYNGWKNTNKRSELAFCKFFDRVEEFKDFKSFSSKFYKNVRCGILHQAETAGGWKIHRDGPLFDQKSLTINATKFLDGLEKYLKQYKEGLKNADLDSEMWNNLRKKMDTLITNCKRN